MTKVKVLAFASFLMMTFPVMAGSGEMGKETGLAMSVIMWCCLLVLLVVGHKMAWKPILGNLNEREEKIRKSLEDADKAQKDLAEIQSKCESLKAEADVQSKQIINEAKETAKQLAKEIEEQAKAEAASVRDGALKEIETAKNEAMQSLREQSSELAISLAGKLLGENLDSEKNRALTKQLIDKI